MVRDIGEGGIDETRRVRDIGEDSRDVGRDGKIYR